MKNAFLILAHNEFEVLRRLVEALDDSRNDIYIHFDRKVDTIPDLNTEYAGLTILKHRVSVNWGAPSMLEAEYALFETAVARGSYQYYHLLSGVDLPIKSQDYIHGFLDRNDGKEFIGYTLLELTPSYVRKMQRWHLFPEDYKSRNMVKRILRAGFLRLQEFLGIYRNRDVDFKKGSQWVSITEGMAKFFLSHKDWSRRVFRNTFCSDELVMQTLCWMSPYRDNLYNTEDDATGCLRAIGWRITESGSQLIDWSEDDFDHLAYSSALFARKFNSSDPVFLDRVKTLYDR